MTTIDQTDLAAWRESRLDGLGGSDIAAVMGLSPWASPYSVWLEKTTRAIEEPTEAQQLRFDLGHDAEVMLATQFHRHTGFTVEHAQTRVEKPDVAWAFAHVDGFAVDAGGLITEGVWEAKTAHEFGWDEVPAHYLCQVQWAMWLSDLDRAFVTVGFAGWTCRTFEVARDEDDIALIVDTAERFWFDNVLAGVAPEIDGSDATAEALRRLHPQHDDDQATEVDPTDITRYRTLKADEKAIKTDLSIVTNKIAASLGDAAVGLVDGAKALTYRTQTRTTTCTECGHQTTSEPYRVLRLATQKGTD